MPGADSTPSVGWAAMIASLAGSAVGLFTKWGIPALNSLLAASVLYWVIKVTLPAAKPPGGR
ncbi:hypothetical protein [Dickeya poaceiphila]|uniref:hypothetical protein n=1 Tax=Dickeya poaceiphila TaxID=568768 RepID=UPI00039C3DAF